MKNRRDEPRFLCADLVRIRITDESGTQESTATLENISASGACIQLEVAVREGADVHMVCAKCRLRGKVRHCRYVQTGYDVGVEFDEPGSWTPERFSPKHLLPVPIR
jgi:hypothetical protein